MKRKVDVILLGHRFTVRTEKDEAYVHALAAQVTRRIDEVRRAMKNATPHEQALLVALNLVDELCEERERAAGARAEVRRHTDSIIAKLSTALLAPAVAPAEEENESDVRELAVAVQRQA
jgi:cell division protein ZapA (FtsZ GTPase activity inhibitor)